MVVVKEEVVLINLLVVSQKMVLARILCFTSAAVKYEIQSFRESESLSFPGEACGPTDTPGKDFQDLGNLSYSGIHGKNIFKANFFFFGNFCLFLHFRLHFPA